LIETGITVLRFGEGGLPHALACFPTVGVAAGFDVAIQDTRRVIVVGSNADLAAVLTRLMRAERLDIEVAHLPGRRGARRAVSGLARRVPLIRDDSATVVVGEALWLPPEGSGALRGEAVVDDTVLFDGEVVGIRIEPTAAMPGLRATVTGGRRRWLAGRAVQLGTTGARVVRDGVEAPREVKRTTLYRHTTGWLRVS